MIRVILGLVLLLVFAGCANAPAPDPRVAEAAQLYQSLRLLEVEQNMLPDDQRLTYGYAVVNCGLRSPQWMSMLQNVYSQDYVAELQRNPLTAEQMTQARAYAEAHVENPSPPPYICQRLSEDTALPQLDRAVGLEALIVANTKKKQG